MTNLLFVLCVISTFLLVINLGIIILSWRKIRHKKFVKVSEISPLLISLMVLTVFAIFMIWFAYRNSVGWERALEGWISCLDGWKNCLVGGCY